MKNYKNVFLAAFILSASVNAVAAPQSLLDRVREGYFLIAGYPSTIISSGPPQDGLISLMEFFSSSAQTIAQSNGVAACAAVPASGTVAGSITVPASLSNFLGTTGAATLTYGTPVVTAPAGWNGAGSLFQKRVLVTRSGGIAFAMEFNCGTDELFTSLSIPGDNVTNSTRDINLYISKSGASVSADFLMTVSLSSRTNLVDSQLVRLVTTNGVVFKVSNTNVTMRDATYTCGGSACGDQFGYERSVMVGNATTKISSLYYKAVKPDLTGSPALATRKGLITEASTTAAAGADPVFSASEGSQNSSAIKSGCVNFVTRTDPGTGAFCSGDGTTLPDPTAAPLADASGSFTVNWVKSTLASKMKYAN
ncbi:MAG: hypothetical protein H7326_11885 [Bdellovibrionaceae bacterium]|nr:hypothetical protein [Pseudobdellovibrionaceae bacterium]